MGEKIRPCKFCKSEAKVEKLLKCYEVYCPTLDSTLCPYPPVVNGDTREESIKQWNSQFGLTTEVIA